jgi:hypothetical protein
MAKPNWSFVIDKQTFNTSVREFPIGNHGYDPDLPDMTAIFLQRGISQQIPSKLSNLNIYGLICALLDLKPAPNNGTLSWH